MIIDLQSIYMDSELHRLCWKQFEDISGKKYISIQGDIIRTEENGQKIYCIEKLGRFSEPLIITNMEGSNQNVTLTVDFSMPLAPPLPVIRLKVSHNRVYFHLNNSYAGLSSSLSTDCQILVRYKSSDDQSPVLAKIDISTTYNVHYLPIEPGRSFDVYYTCKFVNSITSSKFIFEQGSIFPPETFDQLKPVIIFPFRRFLITKWDFPINIPKAFVVVIYKISQNKYETCLKIFRMFSESTKSSESNEARPLIPDNCNVNVDIEDLGYYPDNSNKSLFAVLDMVTPLQFRKRYKLFISWMDPLQKVDKKFIFFEPLPNLNSGIKNPVFTSFENINFENFRNYIHPIFQNELSTYSGMVNRPFSTWAGLQGIIPILSAKYPPKLESLSPISFDQLEMKCNQSYDCNWNYLYPFYFLFFDRATNNFFEIDSLPKPENTESKVLNSQFKQNNANSSFTVSWEIKPGSVVQSVYLIKIKLELKDNCSMLYILKCRTCNGKQKQIAEEKSSDEIKKWKKKCGSSKTFDNYYQAIDRNILFHTNEMVPETMFRAEIYSFGLYVMTKSHKTNTAYIKESFWRNYKAVVISVIAIVCVAVVIWGIYMWFRRLTTTDSKEVDQEDSNKYYGEDDV